MKHGFSQDLVHWPEGHTRGQDHKLKTWSLCKTQNAYALNQKVTIMQKL